jgi:hypothetical protein
LQINPKLKNVIPKQTLSAIENKKAQFASGKARVPLLIEVQNPKFKLRPIGFPGGN